MEEKERSFNLNDDSNVTIPLRNLIAIIFATAVAVMGYFNLTARIAMLERDQAVDASDIQLNSEFRIRWPRGELGALPDDAEQNIRLDFIERRMEQIDVQIEKLKEAENN